jgi:Ca2+-binding RTX toxin-like protein
MPLIVQDGSGVLSGLDSSEINTLRTTFGVDQFSGDGDIDLTLAQLQAFSDPSTTTLTPGGDVTLVGDGNNNTLDALSDGDDGFALVTVNSEQTSESTDVNGQLISGLGGNDTLTGGGSTDILNGGSGNDELNGTGGSDELIGGAGDDVYIIGDSASSNFVTEASGGGVIDEVRTTLGDTGTAYQLANHVEMLRYDGSGNFSGDGNASDNFIYGGDGDDTLRGGDGNDRLFGGSGSDTLLGEAGDDVFIIGTDSRSSGRDGTQTVTGSQSDYVADSNVSGGAGIDTLRFQGSSDTDAFVVQTNTSGVERLVLSDQFAIRDDDGSGDSLDTSLALDIDARDLGSAGSWDINTAAKTAFGDALRGSDNMAGVSIDGAEIVGTDGANNIQGSASDDIIIGGKGADSGLDGRGGDDYIFGGVFADNLFGGSGDDMLFGGGGSDTAEGGAGDDVFFGGTGSDEFFGGADNSGDIFVAEGSSSDYTITVTGSERFGSLDNLQLTNTNTAETDTLSGVEEINFGGVMASGDLSGGTTDDISGGFRVFDSDGTSLIGTETSLSDAITTASNGNVIVIADGTTVSGDVTSGVDGSAASFDSTLTLDAESITVRGLDFSPAASGDTSILLKGNDSADGAIIDDNTFTGTGASDAIEVESSVNQGTKLGLEITDNVISGGSNGLFVKDVGGGGNTEFVFRGNTIDGTTTSGVNIEGLNGKSADVEILDNSFSNNPVGVEIGDSPTPIEGTTIVVRDNRFTVADDEVGIKASVSRPAVLDSSLGQSVLANDFIMSGSGDGTKVDISQTDSDGANLIVITDSGDNDFTSNTSADVLRFGAADDTVTAGVGDTIIGGGGNDTVRLEETSGSYTVERVSSDGTDNGINYKAGDFLVKAASDISGGPNSGDAVVAVRGVETIEGSGGGTVADLTTGFTSVDFTVADGGDVTQAFDSAVSGADSITLGSGGNSDFGGANATVTSKASGAVTLDNASNLTLTLSGEQGVDEIKLTGTAGNNFVVKGNGTLEGGTSGDWFRGSAQDDTFILATGGGDDVIAGGSGSDTASFTSSGSKLEIDLDSGPEQNFDPQVAGASTGDYFKGNLGARTLYFEADSSGDSTVENIVGTDQGDTIGGDSNVNDLSGGGGGDDITGGGGADIIDGGDGDDSLSGNSGGDTITGGGGDDDIIGGAGDDRLIGGAGDNRVMGEEGDDTYVFHAESGDNGENEFVGGSGDDTVELAGTISDYIINRADDSVNYASGDDGVVLNSDGAPFDTGKTGYSGDSASGDDFVFDPDEPVFRIERIFDDGSRQREFLQAENFVFDQGDSDTTNDTTFIYGTLAELDAETSGSGNFDPDVVDASGEYVSGGVSDDTDFFTVEGGTTGFTYNGGGDPASLSDPNYVLGSTANDTFRGGDGDDVFLDRGGDDVIDGGVGVDTLDGAAGADIFNGDEDNKVGEGFESGDVIGDTGASGSGTDQVFIADGEGARTTGIGQNSVDFTDGTLSGVEEVLYADRNDDGTADHSGNDRIVDVTSDQFDGVDLFKGSAGNDDRLEINFSNNGDTGSRPTVDDIEDVVLDTSGDGTGGEANVINAGGINRDADVYVRGDANDDNDVLQVDNLRADLDADGNTFDDGYGTVFAGELDVNLSGDTGNDVSIETGSDNTSVTTRSGTTATVDGQHLANGNTLDLDGGDDIVVDNAGSITVDASNHLGFDTGNNELVGTLEVNAKNGADVDLDTGRSQTTFDGDLGTADIDATELRDNILLTIKGSSDATVTSLIGDVDASNSSGVIDITSAIDAGDDAASGDDDIDITAGSNDMRVRGTEGGGAEITVDADAMNTGDQLTLGDQSDFVVNNVGSNVTVSGNGLTGLSEPDVPILDGTLVVATDAGATNVDVETGTGRTTVNTDNSAGSSQNGSVTVDAAHLAQGDGDLTSGPLLEVTGRARFDVDNLVGDIDATAMAGGPLDVSTADAGDDGILIALGDADASIQTAGGDSDTVEINAAGMTNAGSDTLKLGGGANTIEVTNLVGNLDADGDLVGSTSVGNTPFDGTLNVTTGLLEQSDGTEFVLGDGVTNITANQDPSGDTSTGQTDLTIKAAALDTEALSLSGDAMPPPISMRPA